MIYRRNHKGFTLVELMVSIAVLGILFGIVTLGYSKWRQDTSETAVKNDLIAASSAMTGARNWDNSFPSTIPSSFTASKNVTVTVQPGGTVDHYCLKGASTDVTSVVFYVTEANSEPHADGC